jgi:hypothetical protein
MIPSLKFLCSLIVSYVAFSATGAAQAPVDVDDLLTTMERLAIHVPMEIAGRDPIRRHLGELSRDAAISKPSPISGVPWIKPVIDARLPRPTSAFPPPAVATRPRCGSLSTSS